MKYHYFPARWASGIEEVIIRTVHELRRKVD